MVLSSNLNIPSVYCTKMRTSCLFISASCLIVAIITGCQGATVPSDCRRQCSVSDGNLSCWNQSLEYYTQTLTEALIEYSGTLMYLNRWKKRNPELVIDLHKFLQESIQRSLQGHQDDTNVLSASDLENLFNGTIDAAFTREEHFLNEATYLPLFSCPLPCDYSDSMWRALAILLAIAFVLACVAFFIYLCRHEHAWNAGANGKKLLRR